MMHRVQVGAAHGERFRAKVQVVPMRAGIVCTGVT